MRILNEGVTGPLFYEDDAGQAGTVNGTRYRVMLTDFLWLELDSLGRGRTLFPLQLPSNERCQRRRYHTETSLAKEGPHQSP